MSAEVFVHNRIHTLERAEPINGAIVVNNGRVIAVTSLNEARELAGAKAKEIRLDGEAVLPGLHDSHIHIGNMAREVAAPNLRGATTYAEVLTRLQTFSDSFPDLAWICGGRWNANVWADSAQPSRYDLDRIFGLRPAVLVSADGHANWANTAALNFAGIDRNTPDMPGGEIVRDAVGEPTGLLLENAGKPLRKHAESTLNLGLPKLLKTVFHELLATGITMVTDFDGEEVRRAMLSLKNSGELNVRINKGQPASDLELAIREGRRTGEGDDFFRVGPVKFFSDGALGPRTAHMCFNYEGESSNTGIEVMTLEQLVEGFRKANAHGLAVATHAIGDKANEITLNACAEVAKIAKWNGLKNRIEHAQHIRPQDIKRFAELDVVASQQPIHCTSDYPLSVKLLGNRNTRHYPWRSLIDSGVTCAFGSDAPVETPNPFLGIHAAATRENGYGQPSGGREPEERISVLEALLGYTVWGAKAMGIESIAGSLSSGKYADFITVDRDPLTAVPQKISSTRVLTTVINGQIAFKRE